jgi:hypothetical protein
MVQPLSLPIQSANDVPTGDITWGEWNGTSGHRSFSSKIGEKVCTNPSFSPLLNDSLEHLDFHTAGVYSVVKRQVSRLSVSCL